MFRQHFPDQIVWVWFDYFLLAVGAVAIGLWSNSIPAGILAFVFLWTIILPRPFTWLFTVLCIAAGFLFGSFWAALGLFCVGDFLADRIHVAESEAYRRGMAKGRQASEV